MGRSPAPGPAPRGRGPGAPGSADAGSATVWWISLSLVLWFLVHAVLLTSTARLDRGRAATAADLAALAAAARVHEGADAACAVARRTAEANGADLDTCDLDGLTVEVTVSRTASSLPHEVIARSRAGPVHHPE
ncbi:flp pilus-assembly TadE/G-like family protein [Nocardiopsis eucommiae]|uniref:Flp pilus-assembly TadE/G-like family protein n=1 Tax=Nocardiopsis eucommiae TaxID=2831970 RepID=A0A975QKW5_9ACTN|nr:flp pilus-assembly TadE/G-like family protein [Nocardiopsis eucommiae]